MMTGDFHDGATGMGGRASAQERDNHLFRVITVDGKRTALKLERVFWDALEQLAREQGRTKADIIAAARDTFPEERNLTSAVRQFIAASLATRKSVLERRFAAERIAQILNACPAPACALSSERRLRFTNPAFLRFVKLNLPVQVEAAAAALRMQIDMPMAELLEMIASGNGVPVSVGFAIGLNDRRLRGRMNVIEAPCWDERMILGYVVT